jgi:hypothetical protein
VDYQRSSSEIYGNVSYDFNAAVRVMAEYQHMETLYGASATINPVGGNATSTQLGSANIFRVAAFYFF